MKKLLSLVLCAFMILGITGCSNDDEVISTTETESVEEQNKEEQIEEPVFYIEDAIPIGNVLGEKDKYLNQEILVYGALIYHMESEVPALMDRSNGRAIDLYLQDDLIQYNGFEFYMTGYIDEYGAFTVTGYELKDQLLDIDSLDYDIRKLDGQRVYINGYISGMWTDNVRLKNYGGSNSILIEDADTMITSDMEETKVNVIGTLIVKDGVKLYIRIEQMYSAEW